MLILFPSPSEKAVLMGWDGGVGGMQETGGMKGGMKIMSCKFNWREGLFFFLLGCVF